MLFTLIRQNLFLKNGGRLNFPGLFLDKLNSSDPQVQALAGTPRHHTYAVSFHSDSLRNQV